MRPVNTFSRLLLAWIPFFLLWVLFTLAFMETSVTDALVSAVVSTVSAAILGLGVWHFAGWLPWPDRSSPKFVIAQFVAGFPFALLWTIAGYATHSVRMGVSILELMKDSAIFGWRLLMGFWIYAIVAGVSYAVRTRRRLQEQERIAVRAEALALQARLASLRGQLNPHFLFNALNSVTALIRHDPGRAETAVARLAELLRYALDDGDETSVSLEDEWRFTEGYLEMQRLRFGERLRYEAVFNEGTLAHTVPPFVLQPLVENAVEHALSPRTAGGFLSIRASIQERGLVLTVEDDGPGIQNGRNRPGHGHGLETLRARLEALFGGAGYLVTERSAYGGVRAEVVVPVDLAQTEMQSDRESQ